MQAWQGFAPQGLESIAVSTGVAGVAKPTLETLSLLSSKLGLLGASGSSGLLGPHRKTQDKTVLCDSPLKHDDQRHQEALIIMSNKGLPGFVN